MSEDVTLARHMTPLLHRLEDIGRQLARIEGEIKGSPALLDYLGLAPDRYIARYFAHLPENALYEAMYGGSDPLRASPAYIGLTSTLCRQLHFSLDEFRYWARAMGRRPRLHRKDWEWFFIAQTLFEAGMLRPERQGLVFAVGREPLPSVFAAFGCDILATDQSPEQAVQSGWARSNQYADEVASLFDPKLCDRAHFLAHVGYRSLDMNAIPADLERRFDFCWSSCALEHLGSLEHGMRFVEQAMATLKPGGLAVHTTEFNLSSNEATVETEALSVYRRRDIETLTQRLQAAGHEVLPFDWTAGAGFAETVVDLPPYRQSPHLRLRNYDFDLTSLGLIVRRG